MWFQGLKVMIQEINGRLWWMSVYLSHGILILFISFSIPLSIQTGMHLSTALLSTGSLLCTSISLSLSQTNFVWVAECLSISSLSAFRSLSKSTNLGRLMETHGPRLLGASYKNPLESFELFRRFSVEHPEVRQWRWTFKNRKYSLLWSNFMFFSGLLVYRYRRAFT